MHMLQFVFTYLWLGLALLVAAANAAERLENPAHQQIPSKYKYKPSISLLMHHSMQNPINDFCANERSRYRKCFALSFNYSKDGVCHPVLKVEGTEVVFVCVTKTRLRIIGHEIDVPGENYDNYYRIWVFLTDIKSLKFTELIVENLIVHCSHHDIQLVDYHLIKAYNCEIRGLLNFKNVTEINFSNSEIHFNGFNHIFEDILVLEFFNSSLFNLENTVLMISIQSITVSFNNCSIYNYYPNELSLIISRGESSSFINCHFHAANSPISRFLQVEDKGNYFLNLIWIDSIVFDGCTVHGRNKFVFNTDEGSIVSIKNCQFTDIISDNLMSFPVSTAPEERSVTIENSIFRNITSSKAILSGYRDEYLHPRSFFPVIHLFNVSFINNIGTPIFARNLGIDSRSVSFINNTGTYAGPVFIELNLNESINYQQLNVSLINTRMHKNSRKAKHGGDIYFHILNNNVSLHMMFTNGSKTKFFFDASITQLHILSNCTSSFQDISTKQLKTFSQYIDADHLIGSDVFPGKTIFFYGFINVTDYFNNDVSCQAIPSINYDHNEDNCTIQLASNDKIQLKTGKEVMSSVYIIATSVDCLEIKGKVINVEMACDDVTTSVTLILRGCPLGYKPSNHSDHNGQQLLKCEVADEDNFIETDDSKKHIACIDRDYWYGQVNINGSNHPIKVYCGPPYCVQNSEACPLAGYTDTHQKLPWTQDEQCSGLYGGVLCRSCQEHAVFTFGASKCISLNDCKQWQPYLIICLAIVGQIALSLVMICSRAKTTIGVGYLYGPLFFIAVYKLLPISNSYLQHTSPLEYTFSLFETVLLLDLDILGKVNWCMFNNINKTLLYSMRFLGPLVTFMVLLVIMLIARSNFCFKFKINRIIQSPIQPMCFLIILSFWSLSKTSIEIIKPIIINGEWRFAIQPEYNYLGNGYIIGLFSTSVALLMCFYLPFIFLLFSSQFMRRKINLFRIQPFLDAFQSSYKDKYQWFSGVYLFSWLVLNTELPSYVFVIVITGVSVLQFTLHPHKSKLLNITDNLLLADIIIMSSLSYMRNEDHAVMIIKYPLLIIPLIYILLGGVWIPLRLAVLKCRSMILNRRQASEAMEDLIMPIEDALFDRGDIDVHANIQPQEILIHSEMEREPLIYAD